MARTTRTSRLIDAAASRFRRFLRAKSGGRLPRSVRAWCALCERLGLHVGELRPCPPSFTAKLWYDEERHLWFVGYNGQAGATQICRWLCHELFEWLALADYPSLFDGLPGVWPSMGAADYAYYYDGGDNPNDIRHRIGQRGEAICFRKQ